MTRVGDRPSLLSLAVLGAFIGLVIAYLPEITTWMRARADASIGERAYVSCEPPTEHEQLHIIVTRSEGRIAASCMYIGSRGSYTRRSVRQAEAR